MTSEKGAPTLTVIVPTLNAGGALAATLSSLAEDNTALKLSVVVADGGSGDDTAAVARARGAEVVNAARGRGSQLAAGADVAKSDWLMFLHADTRLASGWSESVARFIRDPGNTRRAAAFRFALDDDSPAARRLERVVAWRSRALGLPYGDQGLLITRAFYDEIGGFRPRPLMEDVDIVRRIGRRHLAILDAVAVTSAQRYRNEGYIARSLRNLLCLALYFAGAPIKLVTRLYG